MLKSKIVSAVEVGSSKIATVISQVSVDPQTLEKNINIVGVGESPSKGIRKGQIVDIDEAVEATIASVESAERMAGYNLAVAYVAVGGANIHSQNSHGVVAVSNPRGEIGQEDVDRVIEAASAISLPASREVIHVVPRDFAVDGESGVKDPIGMTGVRLEVETHIITAGSAAVKNLRKALNEVGVEIGGLVYSALAASEAVLTSTEKELGCVLIDIGAGTTSIALFSEGSISYSAVLPLGAMNVTNDLAIGLRVSIETAEKIKVALSKDIKKDPGEEGSDEIDLGEFGAPEVKKVSRKTLTEGIIRPRLNEIFTMVRLDLERQGLLNRVPSGAVVTGGGAETVGVVDCAKRMLTLPVRLGKPKDIGGLVDDVLIPSFAVPIGLIIYGSKHTEAESSGSFKDRLKLPSKGFAGKIVDIFKDLLP